MNYFLRRTTLTISTLKKIYSTLVLLCLTTLAFAQNGTISGTVKTSDGNAADAVTVTIKGSQKAAVTDQNGNYQLRNVKPGQYTLIATLVGLEKQEQSVNLSAGEKLTVSFTLSESTAQLNEVTISARNLNKINPIVAKTPLKKLENPQVYNSVSSELLKQQGIVNFDDAMRNIPGIARTWESTGRSGDGPSYFALRGFEAQPSIYNGLPGFTGGDLDPADIEEIQVLKGPSGTLFGASFVGYGGIINVVTKKPYFTTGGEVTYNTGSFGLNRVSFDINTPLSKTEKIALRVNAAYHTENSFQDAGYKKSLFIAPALTYKVNDKLTLDILTEYLHEDRAVAPVFFHSDREAPLLFKNIAELNLDNKKSFTSNDLPMVNPRFNMQAQMNYKISDQWNSQTVVSRGVIQAKGYYGYIYGNTGNEFTQYIHKENNTSSTFDLQQNFNGDFTVGTVRNRLLVGVDYLTRNVVDNGTGYGYLRSVTPQGETTDGFAPTQNAVDSLLTGTGISSSNTTNNIYAAYFSDVINFTPALSALVSLRADYFDSKGQFDDSSDDFHQFTLSPKFGLVYQPVIDKVSIFGNYLNSFLNQTPRQVADADGSNPRTKSFKPEHANQLEFGVKTNIINDKLSFTVSYYDTRVKNRVTTVVGNINDSDQRGAVRSKGFELDLSANPTEGLNFIAGYSHNSIKNTTGYSTDFYAEEGRAPGGQGPQDLANFWGTYKFSKGSLKDFGFGLGGNYAGIYKVIDNSVVGVFELPSYTVVNASLFYNSSKYRFTFNANNITNEKYYIGYWSVNPQRPVNFSASLAVKF
jgi:iron complex outermembrane receptor protein